MCAEVILCLYTCYPQGELELNWLSFKFFCMHQPTRAALYPLALLCVCAKDSGVVDVVSRTTLFFSFLFRETFYSVVFTTVLEIGIYVCIIRTRPSTKLRKGLYVCSAKPRK